MKKLVILILVICFSCEKKQITNPCIEIEEKYDSLLKLNSSYQSNSFYKFNKVYKKEKQSLIDTVLISEYQSIISDDEVVNSYINARINTISQKKTKNEILNNFMGKHALKPHYKGYDRYVTSVEIKNDSCFIFKDKKLKASGKINLIYSKNKLTPGIFNLDNYVIRLTQPNLILLRDKNCLHCTSLEFIKFYK